MGFLLPHIEKLHIEHRYTGTIVPFKPNLVQRDFLARMEAQFERRKRVRIIVLKARQMGLSTVTQGAMFTMALNLDNYSGLTVAHDGDTTSSLLRKCATFWDEYPFRNLYNIRSEREDVLAWEHGSRLEIATAGNRKAGRGKTVRSLHLSEVAFYPDPRKLTLGLLQAVPEANGTLIVVESTGNGVGDYFNGEWERACAGDNGYEPVFYPWFAYESYRYSILMQTVNVPTLTDLDAEELVLRKLGVDDDQLLWRRYAIQSLCGGDVVKFHQEYPASPEEAFVSTGHNVFPLTKLQACFEPMIPRIGKLIRSGDTVQFIDDPAGPLKIYKTPSVNQEWGKYLIGGDPTRTTSGDFAVGQVISRRTLEQVAVFKQRMNPRSFGEELVKLGLYYNTASIAPEKQGPGNLTVGAILGMNYPNVWQYTRIEKTNNLIEDTWGWNTTPQSKEVAVGQLLACVDSGRGPDGGGLVIHDQETFTEMKNFVKLPSGDYGNANGSDHDDTVMALAIACICHFLMPTLPAWRGAYRNAVPMPMSHGQPTPQDPKGLRLDQFNAGDYNPSDSQGLPWDRFVKDE